MNAPEKHPLANLYADIASRAEALIARYRKAHALNDRSEMAACVADLERLEQEVNFVTAV